MKSKYNSKKSAKLKQNQQKIQKKRKRKIVATTLISVFVVLPLVATSILLTTFALWAKNINLDKSVLPTASALPTYYDNDGNEMEYMQDDYISPKDVPINLKNAFIALEDKRFYKHKGYDLIRIGGAIAHNIKSGSIKEGASTITQQLVKNTHLTQERTFKRKLKEIAIATKLEKEYSKDEIMAMYLSVIYFGNGAYGARQASRLYFDRDIEDLTLAQCATLAGIVKNPKKYSPLSNVEDCINRRNFVLSVMKNQKYIDENDYLTALNEEMPQNINGKKTSRAKTSINDLYIKKANEEICKNLSITIYQLNNSGYKIYTNLDKNVQECLFENSKNSRNFDNDSIQSCTCVLDNENGTVLGYYSTLPYEVRRQTGSVLKPLAVYAPAINEKLITLATPIVDEKVDFSGYSPSNFNDVYYGQTTIKDGIKKSLNSVALKTFDYLSITKSCEYLNTFGIKTGKDDENYAIALGSISCSPLEIASGYAVFANNGGYTSPSFVKAVFDKNNTTVYRTQTNDKTQIIDKSTAQLISVALLDTVKDGTARTLSALPFDVCAKTGTAQRNDKLNSDAWLASYNDKYTVVVWHGSDNGMSEKGGGHPTKHAQSIWNGLAHVKDMPKTLKNTDDIVSIAVDTYATSCYKRTVLASENTPLEYRKTEWFAKNNIPSAISNCFDRIDCAPQFDVKVCNVTDAARFNTIAISFETCPIYSYKLYRTINSSKSLIADIDGSHIDDKRIEVFDVPPMIYGMVTYELKCCITCNQQIKKSSTKQIFVDDFGFFQ